MKDFQLERCVLFANMKNEDIQTMLKCLVATTKHYDKGEFILHQGEETDSVCLVLRGLVHIIKEDFWGNRSIVNAVPPLGIFAEVYGCTNNKKLEVGAVAVEATTILFLNVQKILTVCSSSCMFHGQLVQNLLRVLAEKNLMLTRKMEHMAKKTTREKLLSYLSEQSLQYNTMEFQIPYNRQQLAEYLGVERSAMSVELSKLQKDGYLTFQKNHFCLNPLFYEQEE